MLTAVESKLAEQFNQCVEPFRNQLTLLATRCNKPVLSIYAMWREYCDTCRDYDQSPALSEFQNWYAEQLKAVNA